MASRQHRLQELYGAGGLHLLVTVAALATGAYTVVHLGFDQLWDPEAWWQSIPVWFLGAVLLHDLVLFPLYALADRLLVANLRPPPSTRFAGVPIINHVRVPALAVGLLFLLFFPGILEQGTSSYTNATGQTQEPFLERWLVLASASFGLSAVLYVIRVVRLRESEEG